MSKISLMDTGMAKINDLARVLRVLPKEIMDHRIERIDTPTAHTYLKQKSLIVTPIGELVHNVVLSNPAIASMFAFMSFRDTKSIAEIWARTHFTLDLPTIAKVLPNEMKAIYTFPEFTHASILNVTSLVTKDNRLKDLITLQQLVARNILVRSYECNDKDWLNSTILVKLGQIYAETIAIDIATMYNLNFKEQVIVSTLFTAYFHSRCINTNSVGSFPQSVNYCNYLGTPSEISNILNRAYELNGSNPELTLNGVCSIIKEMLPSRLAKFNTRVLYQREQYLGTCHPSTLIALEYPPYFLYLILLAISGVKNGLALKIRKSRTLKMLGDDLAKAVPTTSSILNNIPMYVK